MYNGASKITNSHTLRLYKLSTFQLLEVSTCISLTTMLSLPMLPKMKNRNMKKMIANYMYKNNIHVIQTNMNKRNQNSPLDILLPKRNFEFACVQSSFTVYLSISHIHATFIWQTRGQESTRKALEYDYC